MSRIGRAPIAVPSGVSVAVGTDNTVTVKGPQGELARTVPAAITIRQDGDVLVVERPDDQRQNRAPWTGACRPGSPSPRKVTCWW